MTRPGTRTPPVVRSIEEDSLLAAIYREPNEDLPRYAYADWCMENGRVEQGEFIAEELRTGITHRLSETQFDKLGLVPSAIRRREFEFFTMRGFIGQWDAGINEMGLIDRSLMELITRAIDPYILAIPTLTMISFPAEPVVQQGAHCCRLAAESGHNWFLYSHVNEMGLADDPRWLSLCRLRWPQIRWWAVRDNGVLVFPHGAYAFDGMGK